ncbi:NUDIX domain, partial [Rhizoctonia solani]
MSSKNIFSKSFGLNPPRTSSPYLSLTSPITRNTLHSLRKRFSIVRSKYPRELKWPVGSTSALTEEDSRPRAAVLVPLCNVNGRPGLLLEVRGKLRNHGGEVSFPGGKVDPTDESHLAAALRETNEELGIDPAQVEILGSLAPPQFSLRGLRVFPYIGFVHAQALNAEPETKSGDAALPSFSMSSIRPSFPEVAHAFHLPLEDIADLDQKQRLRVHSFRNHEPYWSIDVTDKVSEAPGLTWTGPSGIDEVGGSDQPGKLEVWGLTGWYINVLMQWLDVYH